MSSNSTSAVGVIIGSIFTIAIGALVFGYVIDAIDDQRSGKTTEFNTTMDALISFGWLGFTFFGLGILVFASKWIMALMSGF